MGRRAMGCAPFVFFIPMTPRVLTTETLYRGRVLALRLDEVEYAPGRSTRMEIVDHTEAVVILPLDHERNVWFVRQYRHAAGRELLELPAGVLPPGEAPADGARRELQEETGMTAGQLEPLLSFWLAPGYSTEYMHVFLATDLSPAPLAQDEDEVITVVKMPLPQALALAIDPGDSRSADAKTSLALLAAARRCGW
jgi:ADP-ribose pyrophosphatase